MSETLAESYAREFWAARKRLAQQFGCVIGMPDWEDLPENLRALTVAAMGEALMAKADWQRCPEEEGKTRPLSEWSGEGLEAFVETIRKA